MLKFELLCQEFHACLISSKELGGLTVLLAFTVTVNLRVGVTNNQDNYRFMGALGLTLY